ncbi:unnamed protein product, partial [Rotaria socialis]
MKLLPESARTTHAFLKIAKDEQELQEEDSPEQPTTSTNELQLSSTTHGIASRSKLTKTQRNNLKKRANRYK